MKKYIYLAIVILIFALSGAVSIYAGKLKKEKADNARLKENLKQQTDTLANQVTLNLRKDEVIGKIKHERDSIAEKLKIKPKQVEKIIYIDNSTHDTVRVPVPVIIASKNVWILRDSTKCLKYASKLILEGDSLKAERQLLEWNNRITQTFYRDRPRKFLFIRYGKWIYKQKIDSECGESSVSTFNFIR